MSNKPPEKTCQDLADSIPSLKWLKLPCGKIAIGYVTAPDGRQHNVCYDCAKDYEVANERQKIANGTVRFGGGGSDKMYEVKRW